MKLLQYNLNYFISIIKIKLTVQFQYKGWLYANYASNFITITILYYFWLAIANSATNDIMGFNSKYALTSYIILATLLSKLNSNSLQFIHEIRDGNFSVHFVKPYNLFIQEGIGAFVRALYNTVLVALPAYLYAVLFLNLTLPTSLTTGLGFILLIVSSIAVMIAFELLFGMFVIIVTNAWGLVQLKNFIYTFFSGIIMPLSMFPSFLQTFANYLPFKTVVSMPITYYLNPSNDLLINTITLQLLWFIIFIVLAILVWKYLIKKRVVIMGG